MSNNAFKTYQLTATNKHNYIIMFSVCFFGKSCSLTAFIERIVSCPNKMPCVCSVAMFMQDGELK